MYLFCLNVSYNQKFWEIEWVEIHFRLPLDLCHPKCLANTRYSYGQSSKATKINALEKGILVLFDYVSLALSYVWSYFSSESPAAIVLNV